MSEQVIGGVIFWSLFAALILAFLGALLGIRVRVSGRALSLAIGIPAAIWVADRFIASLPPEGIGGGIVWSFLGGMFFGLFWALTRGK